MKKFLSMFAFAAAIVLGAFTLASCGNDDDEDPASVKHNYTIKVELKTNIINQKQKIDDFTQFFNGELDKMFTTHSMTETEAAYWWMEYINDEKHLNALQGIVDSCAEDINDPFLAVTIYLMKDGKEDGFHKKSIYTKYTGVK